MIFEGFFFNSWLHICRSTKLKQLRLSTMPHEKIIFFDLETTGLDTDECDIIQVSAVYEEWVFNAYALPKHPITKGAGDITGFSVSGDDLYLHGNLVNTIPLSDLLIAFIAFLRSFRWPVALAAHNGGKFDFPVLIRVLEHLSLLQSFREVVFGFLDTLPLFKSLCPDLESYSQESLVHSILKKTYGAHDAVEDAKILQELYKALHPIPEVSKFIVRF